MTTRTRLLSLIAVAAVAAMTFVSAPASASPPARDPGLVRIDSGWLRGSVADDHFTYTGVPYAAPPVGERRWRPPARPRSWSGVRDASTPSPFCPQQGGRVGTEDCLHLDVTTPRSTRGAKKPVLVWLHGGGLTVGGAGEQDGARLATGGDMVVVTINYRLGALGFLSSPELDATGGNYGLMDQAAALRWVRRNIAQFGGDPDNVTLAGQSGGARAVCAQLASPLSRGLFHRAIAQSSACDNKVLTRSAARAFGAQATELLGCADAADIAACLRSQPADKLVGVLGRVGREINARASDRPWNPVAGTLVLPQQPADAMRTGTAARVPLIVGATRDELRAFATGEFALTAEEYRKKLVETFGDQADAVLAAYPVTEYESPAVALATALGDWGAFVGACPVLRTADAAAARQPVYAYEFREDSKVVTEEGFPMGSFHGFDMPYLFDLDMLWDPYPELTADQQRLSDMMIDYWSAFARTGNPNGPGRPRWAEYGASGKVLGLSTAGITPTPYAAEHHCGLWAGLPRG
jgi:para-nitrobenzyl esterase